jgi:toxin ParE1/3/4
VRLRYTHRAARELETVLASIAAASPRSAEAVQRRIRDMIDPILQHPLAGQRVSSSGMRRVVVTPYPYLVFYRVSGDDIVIHGVRHGARDPRTMPR